MPIVVRIFEEKPFFKASQSFPDLEAEEFTIPTTDGLSLAACLVRSEAAERKGLILFAPEYGSTRWSCEHYAGHLLDAGYDLFAFDFRNQGDSEHLKDYEPLQWVTQHEVADVRAVLKFLKEAPFCPEEGIGFFGVSRGAGAGIVACSGDPFVKCLVTDGAFGTVATMIRFMIKWVSIYNNNFNIQKIVPEWGYGLLALSTLNEVHRRRKLSFPSVRNALRRLSVEGQRVHMIHGKADGYIRPEIALDLHKSAPKSLRHLWMVEGAKHNQAIEVAEDEYKLYTSEFFREQLATESVPQSMPNIELAENKTRRGSKYSTAGI
jgi:pimeloyl-ACP methyl ester carboxylesterase